MGMLKRCAVLLGVAAFAVCTLVAAPGARAESPEVTDHTYHNLRYEDDFSYLADPSKRTDTWDRLKFVPITDGPYGLSYLSIGGELRERFESYGNQSFGIKAPPRDSYLLQRAQLNFDLHATDYFRAFLQIGDDRIFGTRGVTSTTDTDRLDVNQAFVDFRLPSPFSDRPVFRVGREELLFGFQRLIAVREGPNVRRDFDGFRFTDQFGGATIDLLDVRPLVNEPGPMGDYANYNQRLSGAYLTTPVIQALKADVYWLNYENLSGKYRGVTAVEHRQTYGVRLFGNAAGFDWNFEGAFQTGSFAGHDINANMLAGIAGYTFRDIPWTPRIGVSSNYASGDNVHSSTIGTFNAMYPRLPYFAETSLLVPANVVDVRPVFEFRPVQNVLVVFGWDTLWRASTTDGLYGSAMVEYTNTNKATSSRIGKELSADVRWQVDKHLSLGVIGTEFLAGPAIQEALGKTVTFFVLYAKYKF
jgi:hypothetical protein